MNKNKDQDCGYLYAFYEQFKYYIKMRKMCTQMYETSKIERAL